MLCWQQFSLIGSPFRERPLWSAPAHQAETAPEGHETALRDPLQLTLAALPLYGGRKGGKGCGSQSKKTRDKKGEDNEQVGGVGSSGLWQHRCIACFN